MRFSPLLSCVAGSAVLTGSCAFVASAQSSPHPSPQQSVLPALFPIPRDPINTARYPLPDFCMAMAGRVADSVRWGQRNDTLAWNPNDTLPAVAVQRAKQCLVQLPLDKIDMLSLGIVRVLALLSGDDEIYRNTVSRQLSMTTTVQGKSLIWQSVVTELLKATPVRVTLARQYIAQAPSILGGDTVGLAAQRNMALALGDFAIMIADVSLIDSMADLSTRLEARRYSMITRPTRNDEIEHASIWLSIANLSLPSIAMQQGGQKAIEYMDTILAHGKVLFDQLYKDPIDPRSQFGWRLVGMEAPVIDAPFRFPNTNSRLPELGRISMLVNVDVNCGIRCYPVYFMLRRLQHKYPELRTTLLAQSAGSVRFRTPVAIKELPDQIRAYFIDSLNVASSIAVDTAPSMQLPAPDRRLIYGRSKLQEDYRLARLSPTDSLVPGAPQPNMLGAYVIVDERGRVVWQGALAGELGRERFLSVYLERLLSNLTR